MKKILFAAMALGMCMTSCMNEEFPNAVQYGYINLNVSNDPVMVTRAGDPTWQFSATKDSYSYSGFVAGANKVPAGTYIITAKSHSSIDEANISYTYGEPYFEGESGETVISAGQSKNVVIDCGQAKNSKLTLVNNLNSDVFTNVKLNAITINPDRELSLSSENSSAFYSIGTEVAYNISYTYNGSKEETTIDNNNENYKITINEAAKDYQIKLTSTDNGNIHVSVTYNGEFDTIESEDFTIDAATGDKVTE